MARAADESPGTLGPPAMTALDGGLLARALVRPSQSQAAALRSEAAQTLALALPAKVAMARPTGFTPAHAIRRVPVPIVRAAAMPNLSPCEDHPDRDRD